MVLGKTPKNMTRASEGSKCSRRLGRKEKNWRTFWGDARPIMRREREKRTPVVKDVKVRAGGFEEM